MNTKANDPGFGTTNDTASSTTGLRAEKTSASNSPPHLVDSERIALYVTLAGLLDAGIPLATALAIHAAQRGKAKDQIATARIVGFFRTAAEVRASVKSSEKDGTTDIGSMTDTASEAIATEADNSFGTGFLCAEEISLLRGMAHTDDISPLLKSAAEIILCKGNATRVGPRTASARATR